MVNVDVSEQCRRHSFLLQSVDKCLQNQEVCVCARKVCDCVSECERVMQYAEPMRVFTNCGRFQVTVYMLKCSVCGQTSRFVFIHRFPFLFHTFLTSIFFRSVCRYDGSEDGLLIFNNRLAFSHELLLTSRIEMLSGADSYSRRWSTLLQRFQQCFGMPVPVAQALFNNRRQFQLACMEFEALQHLDYASTFACDASCQGQGRRIVLDGVALKMQSVKSYMLHPHVAGNDKGEGKPRPVFDDIVFVRDPRVRELGRRYDFFSGMSVCESV